MHPRPTYMNAYSTAPLSLSAELDDIRAPVPFLDPRCQAQPKIAGRDAGNGHTIEMSLNPQGMLRYPSFPREPLLIILGSYLRSITISRQFILGISVLCTLTHITADQRGRNHHLIHTLLRLHLILFSLPSASIRRRPPLLHTLANRIQRHPGAQIPARLASAQLDRYSPRHVLRKGGEREQ
jgi:hypothetical protein